MKKEKGKREKKGDNNETQFNVAYYYLISSPPENSNNHIQTSYMYTKSKK